MIKSIRSLLMFTGFLMNCCLHPWKPVILYNVHLTHTHLLIEGAETGAETGPVVADGAFQLLDTWSVRNQTDLPVWPAADASSFIFPINNNLTQLGFQLLVLIDYSDQLYSPYLILVRIPVDPCEQSLPCCFLSCFETRLLDEVRS